MASAIPPIVTLSMVAESVDTVTIAVAVTTGEPYAPVSGGTIRWGDGATTNMTAATEYAHTYQQFGSFDITAEMVSSEGTVQSANTLRMGVLSRRRRHD